MNIETPSLNDAQIRDIDDAFHYRNYTSSSPEQLASALHAARLRIDELLAAQDKAIEVSADILAKAIELTRSAPPKQKREKP